MSRWRPILRGLGLLPPRWKQMKRIPRFLSEWRRYTKENPGKSFRATLETLHPVVTDYKLQAGEFDIHYFYQDIWAARRILKERPASHFDIGSRLDGFISHLLTFMDVTYIDVRPLKRAISGLHFLQADATRLEPLADNSVESISCLHAAEHFGLGRYNDPIDPRGPFKLMKALSRVLAPGGRLYFSVPLGKECVYFNAHRLFAPNTILEGFDGLTLKSFSIISDDWELIEDCSPADYQETNYACGLFEWTK